AGARAEAAVDLQREAEPAGCARAHEQPLRVRYGIRREAGLRRHDDQPALAQRAAAPRKLPAEVAVDVHDPLLELTLEEQPRLHLAVRAHVAVIVDVIAAQVGEERRIKL